MKSLVFAAVLGALLLTGCGTPRHVINYAPSSVMTVQGGSSVGEFNYLPAQNGKVEVNQIENTAMGSVLFEKGINEYYKKAVFSESRLVGIDVANDKNIIVFIMSLFYLINS